MCVCGGGGGGVCVCVCACGVRVVAVVSGGFLIHVGGSRQLQERIGRRKMHESWTLWILRSMTMTKCVQTLQQVTHSNLMDERGKA